MCFSELASEISICFSESRLGGLSFVVINVNGGLIYSRYKFYNHLFELTKCKITITLLLAIAAGEVV